MAGRRVIKHILPILSIAFLLAAPFTYSMPLHRSTSPAQASLDPGIAWVTEPLSMVFDQIQNRIIGLIPGNYSEPSSTEYSTMSKVFSLIDTGIANSNAASIRDASSVASQINYQLLPVNDSSTGNGYYVLMESTTVNRGWGSYMFPAEKNPSIQVIIEAPHPVTDFNSQEIAYSIFTSSYPLVNALLVSGVERTVGANGQTDMAHVTRSIFETAHETFTGFGSVAIQIHSFSAFLHPQEPLVVLSSGDGGLNGALQSIAQTLESSKLSVGIFDGFQHERLGAQDNVQGRYARAFGAGFVHGEISSTVVYNATLISRLESSFIDSVMNGFRFPAYQIDLKIPAIGLGIIGLFYFASFRLSKTKAKL